MNRSENQILLRKIIMSFGKVLRVKDVRLPSSTSSVLFPKISNLKNVAHIVLDQCKTMTSSSFFSSSIFRDDICDRRVYCPPVKSIHFYFFTTAVQCALDVSISNIEDRLIF